MKNATLFALGLLAAGVWSYDSARCQTSPSPPLSLAPPPSNEGAASPAAANSVWPPMAAPSTPSRAAAVSPTPSAKRNVGSSGATDGVAPPTETANGPVPHRAAKDLPPRATAPRAAAVEHAPLETDNVSPAKPIDRSSSSVKPVADHDGFSVGIVDDDDTSSRTTRTIRSRRAKQPNQEIDRVSEQQSIDPGEDSKLKGKLTICRGCK